MFVFALLLATALAAGVADAQAQPSVKPEVKAEAKPEARAEAKDRFDRGVHLFGEGDNAGALSEFKRAYELIPNQVVLFNMGLVYANMRRPVDAVAALERVLADPGPLSSEQVARAKETLTDQQRRIGFLNVATSVPASIEVDGVEVATTPLEKPIAVAQGTHVVGASASGYLPRRREITIAGGARQDVVLELQIGEGTLAQLTIKSALPGVQILIDGEPVGTTPLAASVTVQPGTKKVEARRAGYATETRKIDLGSGASGELVFDLAEDASASEDARGSLELTVENGPATVVVDGHSRGVYSKPLRLPVGAHRVRVERDGYEASERIIDITAGRTTHAHFELIATAATIASERESGSVRRLWGWVGVGVGAAIIATGVLTFVVQRNKIRDIDTKLLDHVEDSGRECDPHAPFDTLICERRKLDLDNDRENAVIARNGAVGGATLGVALAGVGTYLLITGYRLSANAERATEKSGTSAAILPWLQPGGGGLVLRGAF